MPINALLGGAIMGAFYGLSTVYRHFLPGLMDKVSDSSTIYRDRANAKYLMRVDTAYRMYRRVNGGIPPFETRELPSWMPQQSPAATRSLNVSPMRLLFACDQPRKSHCNKRQKARGDTLQTVETSTAAAGSASV